MAGLSASTLNLLAGGYVASRAVYNFVYINNTTDAMAGARTGAFLAGIGCIMTLFVKAGGRMGQVL